MKTFEVLSKFNLRLVFATFAASFPYGKNGDFERCIAGGNVGGDATRPLRFPNGGGGCRVQWCLQGQQRDAG
ncbi:MAG: hypothetical protein JPMHGGIA_00155 [Saprospiraceae bacterium]|jgi:hypothetical protein|nr:hypothetical protein [Saprospiraceae bacterium]